MNTIHLTGFKSSDINIQCNPSTIKGFYINLGLQPKNMFTAKIHTCTYGVKIGVYHALCRGYGTQCV